MTIDRDTEDRLTTHLAEAPDLAFAAAFLIGALRKFRPGSGGILVLPEGRPIVVALDGTPARQIRRRYRRKLPEAVRRLVELTIVRGKVDEVAKSDPSIVGSEPRRESWWDGRPVCSFTGFHPTEGWKKPERDPLVHPQPGDRFCRSDRVQHREIVAIDAKKVLWKRTGDRGQGTAGQSDKRKVRETDRVTWDRWMRRAIVDDEQPPASSDSS